MYNEYINWLVNYINRKGNVRVPIYNTPDICRLVNDSVNLRSLKTFYSTFENYCKNKNIVYVKTFNEGNILFTYQNVAYEVGLSQADGGYIYCRKINSYNQSINLIVFENVLNNY